MWLANTVSLGGQLILIEVPVITAAGFAILGWAIKRTLSKHDARLTHFEESIEKLDQKTVDIQQSVALLIAGDLDDEQEIARTRNRLHILENNVTVVRGRLELLYDRLGIPLTRQERGD